MKNSILIICSALAISFTACKTKSKAQTTTNTDATTNTANCAAKVNFGSPGTGVDGKTMDALKAMIDAKKLKYTEKRMGREGETEWCLPLTELKEKDKMAFIEQLKKTAAAGQYVSVSTN
jgi:hypothetical protein